MKYVSINAFIYLLTIEVNHNWIMRYIIKVHLKNDILNIYDQNWHIQSMIWYIKKKCAKSKNDKNGGRIYKIICL